MFLTDYSIRQLRRLSLACIVVGACSLVNVSRASCPVEEASQLALQATPTVAAMPAAPVRSSHSQCLINWAEVQNAGRAVVDIRSAAAYAQLSVAGSLNIPASSLKNREFLKPQSLLLIDDGKSISTLQGLCDDLTDAGFKDVRALQGGLRTLHAMGQPVIGSPRQIEQLGMMTAKEFHAVVGRPGWQVVGVGRGIVQAKELFIPVAKIIAEPVTPAALTHALTESFQKNSATTLIVIGVTDALRIDSQNQLSAEHRAQVVFLADSLDGYAAFLNQQNLMLAQAGKPLVRPCTQW